MKIGSAIKATRVERGLSQGELASLLAISQTSLSQIENDVKQPSKTTLSKISKALNVPEVYFYVLSIDKEDVPEGKKELYDIMYPSIQDMMKKLVI